MGAHCRVCQHIERWRIDLQLAAGFSPQRIARDYLNLSRRQVKGHLTRCLSNKPDIMLAFRRGNLSVEGFARFLEAEGCSPEEVEGGVAYLRGLLEKAS